MPLVFIHHKPADYLLLEFLHLKLALVVFWLVAVQLTRIFILHIVFDQQRPNRMKLKHSVGTFTDHCDRLVSIAKNAEEYLPFDPF